MSTVPNWKRDLAGLILLDQPISASPKDEARVAAYRHAFAVATGTAVGGMHYNAELDAASRALFLRRLPLCPTGGSALLIRPHACLEEEVSIDGPWLPGTDYRIYAHPGTPGVSVVPASEPSRSGGPDVVVLGGFHTLCVDIGPIPLHPLSGLQAGVILPLSVWTPDHAPALLTDPDGMVYDPETDLWVDIYLASDIGPATKSAYGGRPTVSRTWEEVLNDARSVGKRLLSSDEFSSAAAGSNEISRIASHAHPRATGGHRDQHGRRMVSSIGCEDCCGALWQWLSTPDPDHQEGGVLLAGGYWDAAAYCGSRARDAYYYRWGADANSGGRFAAEPRKPRARQENAHNGASHARRLTTTA